MVKDIPQSILISQKYRIAHGHDMIKKPSHIKLTKLLSFFCDPLSNRLIRCAQDDNLE